MTIPSEVTLGSCGHVTLGKHDDDKGRRSFAMAAYTGAVFDIGFGPAVIDLAGMAIPKTGGIPILRQHDPKLYVGRSEFVAASPSGLSVTGFLFEGIAAAEEVATLSDQGAQWQASIGIGIDLDAVEFVGDGDTATLNDRKVEGPVLVLRKTTLKETSFVPLGADSRTSAVALSDLKKKGVGMTDKTTLEQERERVGAISAEFADDPAFAMSAITKGSSLLEAKAGYAEKLKAELAEQQVKASAELASQLEANKTELTELRAELAQAKKANPAAALTINAGPPVDGDSVGTWESALAVEVVRLTDLGSSGLTPQGLKLHKSCGVRAMAANNVARANPELHQLYLAAFNAELN